MKLSKNAIEFISIVYFTIIFVLIGIFLTELNDRFVIYKFIREDSESSLFKKSLTRHIIETTIIIVSLSTISYYATVLLNNVPFFLDNINGFNYKIVKTIQVAAVLRLCIFLFSTGLRNKINIVNQYLSN